MTQAEHREFQDELARMLDEIELMSSSDDEEREMLEEKQRRRDQESAARKRARERIERLREMIQRSTGHLLHAGIDEPILIGVDVVETLYPGVAEYALLILTIICGGAGLTILTVLPPELRVFILGGAGVALMKYEQLLGGVLILWSGISLARVVRKDERKKEVAEESFGHSAALWGTLVFGAVGSGVLYNEAYKYVPILLMVYLIWILLCGSTIVSKHAYGLSSSNLLVYVIGIGVVVSGAGWAMSPTGWLTLTAGVRCRVYTEDHLYEQCYESSRTMLEVEMMDAGQIMLLTNEEKDRMREQAMLRAVAGRAEQEERRENATAPQGTDGFGHGLISILSWRGIRLWNWLDSGISEELGALQAFCRVLLCIGADAGAPLVLGLWLVTGLIEACENYEKARIQAVAAKNIGTPDPVWWTYTPIVGHVGLGCFLFIVERGLRLILCLSHGYAVTGITTVIGAGTPVLLWIVCLQAAKSVTAVPTVTVGTAYARPYTNQDPTNTVRNWIGAILFGMGALRLGDCTSILDALIALCATTAGIAGIASTKTHMNILHGGTILTIFGIVTSSPTIVLVGALSRLGTDLEYSWSRISPMAVNMQPTSN